MSLKLGLRSKIRRSRSAGAGFTGLLDQSFSTGATAAYSLRRLKSSATKAVRVREDSGNTETDIGFSGGTLDTTALLNHCGSNNGFVVKWYDQSGNSNDASNSTAAEQPQIVDSGSVIKENGKPALDFDGSDDNLVANSLTTGNQPITQIAVAKITKGADLSNLHTIFSGASLSDRAHIFIESSKFSLFAGKILNGSLADTSQHLFFALFNSTNSFLSIGGTQDVTGDAGTNNLDTTIEIGSQAGNVNNWNGIIQEILYYNSDQSSNQTKIETNINNHYSIF